MVLKRKTDGGLTTNIYRKKTFTGDYPNWKSLTSKSYKLGLITCLLDRAWKFCSDLDLFHIEVLNLKRILNKNDYPADIIDSVITKCINRKMAANREFHSLIVIDIKLLKVQGNWGSHISSKLRLYSLSMI